MTYDQAKFYLPQSAKWSCSFGNPGEDHYSEFWRDELGHRYEISRADSYDKSGWKIECEIAS